MGFRDWLHHLFNPHCHECEQKEQDRGVCQSCEILKHQLEIANLEKMKLLDSIIKKDEPTPVVETPTILRPRHMPWAAQRQQLEKQEAIRATQLRIKKEQEINQTQAPIVQREVKNITDDRLEDLEKELGVGAEDSNASEIG